MAPFEKLHLQNHKLTESSNLLSYLLQERSMCDTGTACTLLYEFLDNIDEHIRLVGSLYHGLLIDKDKNVNNKAQLFMSGERELKRVISQYTKKWCARGRQEIRVGDHDQFAKETRELFEIILSRIQDETEHLYPLVRQTRQAPKQRDAMEVA